MLTLLKKDFLITKRMWMIVMILARLLPAFVSFVAGGHMVPAALVISSIYPACCA